MTDAAVTEGAVTEGAVTDGTLTDTVARVYRQMEREFGVLAPPVALHSPAPDALAACWVMLRETLLVTRSTPRSAKEAVAAAVSAANSCPYCVTMHTAALRSLTRGKGAAAREALTSHEPYEQLPSPAEHDQNPELVAVAVVFQYINRMVNVFLGEAPMPPGAPAAALGVVTRVLSSLIRSAARRIGAPGASLDLLPEAPLPADLKWAAPEPGLADAFARASAAIGAGGLRSVPPRVRELVAAELDTWDGRPKGPSRAWVEGAVTRLPEPERPAGRLALLTALASYQVDDAVVGAYRDNQDSDSALVELTSWSSLEAARRTVGG